MYQHDRKIAKVKGGQFVGEVGFICGDPRTATVIADTDLVTFCINRSRFMYLPATLREKIKDRLINGLVDRVESMNEHIAQLDDIITHYQADDTPAKHTPQAPMTAQVSKPLKEHNGEAANNPSQTKQTAEQAETEVTSDQVEFTKTPNKLRKPTWK